jgi:hypothetical protein
MGRSTASRLPVAYACRSAYMNLHAYEVEFFKTASQIPNELWDACFQPPAEGRWWYETLDQSGIDDQFTLLYGLIKHLGRPVGIAPVFVMDLPVEQFAPQEFLRLLRLVGKIVPSVLCQRTLFVGSPLLPETPIVALRFVVENGQKTIWGSCENVIFIRNAGTNPKVMAVRSKVNVNRKNLIMSLADSCFESVCSEHKSRVIEPRNRPYRSTA